MCFFGIDPSEVSWRKKWQPTPVFLPGESHGSRSLAGYSPWGCKKSDTTEGLDFCFQKVMLWKCHTQYASKFGKVSSGHRAGKGQFSFQSQRKAMAKNVQSERKWKWSCSVMSDSLRPVDCSPRSTSSVHGILQARILVWVAISFSRIFPTQGSSPGLPHCRQML